MTNPTHQSIEKTIYQFAEEQNLLVGICLPDSLEHILPILENQPTPFVTKNLFKRITPALYLPDAKSIIVLGKSYAKHSPTTLKNTGYISQMAIGPDYHIVLTGLMDSLAQRLLSQADFHYKTFVDHGPVVERELAVKAGLGFYGRHHNVISTSLGSFFNIGWMLTNLPLRSTVGYPQPCCAGCQICVKNCPGGALDQKEDYDYKKCVSYITQKPGELSEEEVKSLNGWVYGCDLCQTGCPYNRQKPSEETKPDGLYPELSKLCHMTEEEFLTRFGGTAAQWRGQKIIERNAVCSLNFTKQGENNNGSLEYARTQGQHL